MDTKTRIMESVIVESKDGPISKINTISVSNKARTSESNLYKIFKTKKNLLIETFLYIDQKIGKYLTENITTFAGNDIPSTINYVKDVWTKYLEFFVSNYDYALYYSTFRISKLYTDDVSKMQQEHFIILTEMFEFINRDLNIYSMFPFALFWSFVLDTTLLIAKRMGNKEVEYSDVNVELSFHLVFDGLINILLNNNGRSI